jgi:large subunit ribosomal protein L6
MSRLASKPIQFESSVSVVLEPGQLKIKGPKGEIAVPMKESIEVKLEDNKIFVNKRNEGAGSLQGLIWSLVNNAVTGVTHGFSKKLEIVGKGWRSTVKGNNINLQVGYSHPVDIQLPAGVTATQENPGGFTLHSHDKQLLGQVCANIQKIRPVEPYKLKGIRIQGQYLRKKVRKTAGV